MTNGKSDHLTVNQAAAGGPSPFSPDKHLTTTFVEFHSHIPNDPVQTLHSQGQTRYMKANRHIEMGIWNSCLIKCRQHSGQHLIIEYNRYYYQDRRSVEMLNPVVV